MLREQPKSGAKSELDRMRREYLPDSQKQEVCLIDFGLSKRIINDGKHITEGKARHFVGTAGFSSLNSHLLVE